MRRVVHALAIPAMVILWPVAQTVAAEAPGSDDILTGAAAFGDWKESRPGAWRLITPADMPAPYVTKSVNVGPRLVSRPDHPELRTLDGFAAELVATLEQQYDSRTDEPSPAEALLDDQGRVPTADQLGAEFEAFLRKETDHG